jgi:hypothetical protein
MTGNSMGFRAMARRHPGRRAPTGASPPSLAPSAPADRAPWAMTPGKVMRPRRKRATSMTSTMLRNSTILSGSKMRVDIVSKKIGTAMIASNQQDSTR